MAVLIIARIVLEAKLVGHVPLFVGAGTDDFLPVFLGQGGEESCELGREVTTLKQLRKRVYVHLLTVPLVLRIIAAAARAVLIHGFVPTIE